jgi:hypothetical protein
MLIGAECEHQADLQVRAVINRAFGLEEMLQRGTDDRHRGRSATRVLFRNDLWSIAMLRYEPSSPMPHGKISPAQTGRSAFGPYWAMAAPAHHMSRNGSWGHIRFARP